MFHIIGIILIISIGFDVIGCLTLFAHDSCRYSHGWLLVLCHDDDYENVYAHSYSSDTVDENDHRNMTMMLVMVMLLLVTTS